MADPATDRERRREAARRWREANPERSREASRRYREANRERERRRQREQKRRSRALDPVASQMYIKTYREMNREALQERRRQREGARRAAVFAHYGQCCACCGTHDQLTIDHVTGGGSQHRKEVGGAGDVFYRWLIANGFPRGFQTLCNSCNTSKADGPACRKTHGGPT